MSKYPTPVAEGHYWAKLIHPSGMPEGDDWASVNWEVVQVFENGGNPRGDEYLKVHVPGIAQSQCIEDFVWGPEVPAFK